MSEQNFTISPKGVSKILRVAPLKSYKVKHRNAVRMTEPVCGVYVAEQLNGAEEAAESCDTRLNYKKAGV